jgi:signal transduction histidine kinase
MADPLRMLSAPTKPKGRLISIFAGAVLLPSVALSVLSFYAVPKQAEAMQIQMVRQAERALKYVEADLDNAARTKALEAARSVGTELLLEGRSDAIQAALSQVGMAGTFDTLILEASSPRAGVHLLGAGDRDLAMLREAIEGVIEPIPGPEGDDALPLTGGEGGVEGMLRFRFSCGYVHGTLLRRYFETDFINPDQAWVIRVTEPKGQVVYETTPTPGGRFEVERVMSGPSFRGLKLFLRYKDRSIAQDVKRLAITKTVMIGFIDLLLGAGLFLVYSNVKREIHLSRLKSDFVANVSHELKTPLALIRLFGETLELGRVPNEEKAQQYYRVINKESERLTQLINNILDFSRIEAGRKEYRFAPADVGRIIDDVVEAYRFPIEQQGFGLEVKVADDLPETSVDKEALSQALINLVNNAIKYSREEKSIRIEARRDDGRILVSVADRGIGVAKSEQKKIFEKFYRAEDSLVHETKGSGLGLSLVRHIMEAHGGAVEVESTPGSGSVFTLVLPVGNTKA